MPRLLLVLALLQCTPPTEPSERPAAPDASTPTPAPASPAETEAWFFAVVQRGGVQHCPGASIEWVDVRPLLGLTGVSGPGTKALDDLVGAAVLARGQAVPQPPEQRPAEFVVDARRCPIPQMRSDWIPSPDGFIVDRGGHPPIEHFEVTTVRPLAELAARLEPDAVLVEFRNPLPFELRDIQMVVHYEGCYGKPGTTAVVRKRPRLGPGEAWTERFGVIAEDDHGPGERKGGPAARQHLARSVQLLGSPPADAPAPAYFDLDVALARLGVDVQCPARSTPIKQTPG